MNEAMPEPLKGPLTGSEYLAHKIDMLAHDLHLPYIPGDKLAVSYGEGVDGIVDTCEVTVGLQGVTRVTRIHARNCYVGVMSPDGNCGRWDFSKGLGVPVPDDTPLVARRWVEDQIVRFCDAANISGGFRNITADRRRALFASITGL